MQRPGVPGGVAGHGGARCRRKNRRHNLSIAAFVAAAFERAAANMFVFTLAMIVFLEAVVAGITVGAFAGNLMAVTLGNIVGGSVFVALIYYVIYLRGSGPGTDV